MLTEIKNKKTIFITALGSLLEWYDFSIYTLLMPIMTIIFFTNKTPFISLMITYFVFAIAYVIRPLSGIVFSHMGDRLGRKVILSTTTKLMCLPMLVIALLPTNPRFNILAICILFIMRAIQGFAVGGEYSGVIVMLLEQAPKKHTVLVTSMAGILADSGIWLCAITINLLTKLLSNAHMLSWGWRIPFIIGFIIALWSYHLQKKLHESPAFNSIKKKNKILRQPFKHLLTHYLKEISYSIILWASNISLFFTAMAYLPSYLIKIRHFPKTEIFSMIATVGLIHIVIFPIAAFSIDKMKRKTALLIYLLLNIFSIYPLFLLLMHNNIADITLSFCLLVVLYAIGYPVASATSAELFPVEVRYSGVALGSNLASVLFGAFTPIIITLLIHLTHHEIIAAFYLIMLSVIALFSTLKIFSTESTSFQTSRSEHG